MALSSLIAEKQTSDGLTARRGCRRQRRPNGKEKDLENTSPAPCQDTVRADKSPLEPVTTPNTTTTATWDTRPPNKRQGWKKKPKHASHAGDTFTVSAAANNVPSKKTGTKTPPQRYSQSNKRPGSDKRDECEVATTLKPLVPKEPETATPSTSSSASTARTWASIASSRPTQPDTPLTNPDNTPRHVQRDSPITLGSPRGRGVAASKARRGRTWASRAATKALPPTEDYDAARSGTNVRGGPRGRGRGGLRNVTETKAVDGTGCADDTRTQSVTESSWGAAPTTVAEPVVEAVPPARVKRAVIEPHMTEAQWDLYYRMEAAEENYNTSELSGWPWMACPDALVTQAPFVLNEYTHGRSFKSSEAQQTSPFFRIHKDCLFAVLAEICSSHHTMNIFSRTCQTSFKLLNDYVTHWDMARHKFNGCQYTPEEWRLMDKREASAHTQPVNEITKYPLTPDERSYRVGPVTVVAPFRHRSYFSDAEPYSRDFIGANLLYNACYTHADSFQYLYLHRVPMVNAQMLELLVPRMKNLKMLGVYRCPMIHVGETLRLLRIVKIGRTESAQLDFFPRLNKAPLDGHGTFAVTFDDPQCDSRLGIWSIVYKAIPIALAQNIDLLSEQNAFWMWIEQTPCTNRTKIMGLLRLIWRRAAHRKLKRPHGDDLRDDELSALMKTWIIEDPSLGLSRGQQRLRPGLVKFTKPTGPAYEDSINGRLVEYIDWANARILPRRQWGLEDGIWEYFPCRSCGWWMPACLFRDSVWWGLKGNTAAVRRHRIDNFSGQCEGCYLQAVCEDERDHEKLEMRKLMLYYIGDPQKYAAPDAPSTTGTTTTSPPTAAARPRPAPDHAARVYASNPRRRAAALELARVLDARFRDQVHAYVQRRRTALHEPLSAREDEYYWRVADAVELEAHAPIPGNRRPVGPVIEADRDKFESIW